MNQRSYALLTKLVQANSYMSIESIASECNVSRRTIYNDIHKINDWLKEKDLSVIKQIRYKGIYLENDVKKKLTDSIDPAAKSYYEYSQSERIAWIYVILAISNQVFFLRDLMALFQVSRNTILSDISILKKDLQSFGLTLYSKQKKGYTIEGEEKHIRQFLLLYLDPIIHHERWPQGMLNVATDTNRQNLHQPYFIFDSVRLKVLENLLMNYEKELQIEFTDENLYTLIIWFYLFLERIQKGRYVDTDSLEFEVIQQTKEFDAVKTLCAEYLLDSNILVPEEEIHYLAKFILSAKVNYNLNPQLENNEMKMLTNIVEKMIVDFQQHAAVDFPDKKTMVQNLLLHLRPAYYRIKYGIPINNVLCETIKKNYPEIFRITKKVVHHFETFVNQPIDDHEIAYIAIHFGGWLRREGVQLPVLRKKLLIVCTTGLGTSRMLEAQLKEILPNVIIKGVQSLREYHKTDLEDIDFIVSTIPLPNRGKSVYVVQAILDYDEKEELMNRFAVGQGDSKLLYRVDTIMDIVKRYSVVHEEELLRKELKIYLQKPAYFKKQKPNLNRLLTSNRMIKKDSVKDWNRAIELAAQPLLNQGYITQAYIQKMIEYVEKNGPYIVISDQFALPHARPQDGVLKTGMSMLSLKNPVHLMGKTVSIFIVLSSIDNEQHLKAVTQLTKLLSNSKDRERFFKSSSTAQMTRLIHQYSTM